MADSGMKQVRQAQQWAQQQGLEALDADLLLAFVLDKSRTWLFTWPERELSDDQQRRFGDLIQRRLNGVPVAHILGTREFWSLPLKVNASTLIPRPDTETLVEAILNRFEQPSLRVADLGTGTGAIALALASERPGWNISAFDVQPGAVALAQENAHQLGLPVTVGLSHWCDALANRSQDLLVSNPPYIAADDVHLQHGDVRFEPLSAL
ncbi:MAG TPA: peptide chain release factor N(5)-glutamine methyltransferase, partial [Saccharospirillum sp.]|nr:peptide chain release factor N(5)-glutamine methyltransferase [Saccharospirillum sp.]